MPLFRFDVYSKIPKNYLRYVNVLTQYNFEVMCIKYPRPCWHFARQINFGFRYLTNRFKRPGFSFTYFVSQFSFSMYRYGLSRTMFCFTLTKTHWHKLTQIFLQLSISSPYSEDAYRASREHTMSVILGDDLVPRLSIQTMQDLKVNIMTAINDCPYPKVSRRWVFFDL